MADETVTQRLVFDAAQALEALKEVNKAADTAAGKANLLNKKLQDYSRALGQSWKTTLAQFKELVGTGGEQFTGFTTPLGQDVTASVFKETEALAKVNQNLDRYVTEDTRAAAANKNFDGSVKQVNASFSIMQKKLAEIQAKGRLSLVGSSNSQIEQLKSVIREVSMASGTQYEEVGKQLQKMGIPAAQARAAVKGLNAELTHGSRQAQGFRHGIDVIRTALGTLTAVGIFTFLNAIQKGFADAVKASRELEDSLFRLGNVEKILSGAGQDISLSGLKKGIQDIKKLFPIFSEEDVTQLVAQIAISTKELGLSEKQILDLAKAVGVLNIRSTEEETATQTAQKVISSLITDNARGVANLGLSFNENTLQIKGMELGIITATHKLKDLTNEEKAQIKFQVLLENTNGELANVGDYLDTNTAKLKQNSASWHDLLTAIGSIFTALTPLMTPFLQLIQDGVNGFKTIIVVVLAARDAIIEFRKAYVDAITTFNISPAERLKKVTEAFGKIGDKFKEGLGDKFKDFFPTVPANAPDWFKKIFGSFTEDIDTPTAAVNNFQKAIDSIDTEKAQDALRDLLKSLEDLQKKMAENEADFQTKLARFDQDTLREREDLIEDYNLNVTQTIRQFALRRKEIEDKHRQKELEDERRFQEQMRQLREKFLYDLEDALRERDARQVLRLIDKYNMDKTALENENALRKKAADEDKKIEIDRLKAEEEERLRVMAEEFAVRMQRFDEESALKRQRMEEDHAIEMQRLREQIDEKLKLAADKMAEEYGLNAEGAQAIYDLLKQYYGSDGALAQLTAQGYYAMLGQAQGFLSRLVGVIAQYQSIMAQAAAFPIGSFGGPVPNASTGPVNPVGTHKISPGAIPKYAKGGQFVATKPTTAMFGEEGDELVTITPLSQLGSMQGKKPLDGSDGLNGRNGQQKIVLDMNLSPDLEARVVTKAMDGTANVVERINRGKR